MTSDVGREAHQWPTFTRGSHTEGTSHVSVSTVFDVLSDECRRHLLYFLIEEAGGSASLSTIADRLADVDPGAAPANREDALVDLHHRHLPKLEAAGLVEFDGPDGPVRYREDPLVEECLMRVAARDLGRQP